MEGIDSKANGTNERLQGSLKKTAFVANDSIVTRQKKLIPMVGFLFYCAN